MHFKITLFIFICIDVSSASLVEPIMGRFFGETSVGSISNNSEKCLTNSKRTRKRLTNYDARLIAEASFFTPYAKRRLRKPLIHSDSYEYTCKRSLTNESKLCSLKIQTNPNSMRNDRTSFKLNNQGLLFKLQSGAPISSINSDQTNIDRLKFDSFVDTDQCSSDSTPPLVYPSTSYPLSSAKSENLFDLGPPSICSTINADENSEPFSLDSERPVPSLDLELSYHSPLNTPLLQKSEIHDSNDFPVYANRVWKNPDYTSRTFINKLNCLTNHAQSYDTENLNLNSPPPPLLQPESPPLGIDHSNRNVLNKSNFIGGSYSPPRLLFESSNRPNESLWPNCHNNPNPVRRITPRLSNPSRGRLIVTLKRIGPTHYQITQSNSLYIS